jgi:hypothetical protein
MAATGIVWNKTCERCVHYWIRPDYPKPSCGSGNVTQYDLLRARGEDGDCAPRGKWFVPNPSKLEQD